MHGIRFVKAATLFAILTTTGFSQVQTIRKNTSEKVDTTNLDLKVFSEKIIHGISGNEEKAAMLLSWVSNHLDWKSTDYEKRNVRQILVRGGGNCFELASVYMAMIKAVGIEYRPISELNLHSYSEQRQQNAESRIREVGNRASVFGRQHNDHRWVEVHNEKTGEWLPVDPSMNVIGTEQWLKARVWFGKRITIDTTITNDMIVPFEVYVVSPSDKMKMEISRSRHYLIDEFDKLYLGRLSSLPAWQVWKEGVLALEEPGRKAFANEENLHRFTQEISKLTTAYGQLKAEYVARYRKETP